MKSIKLQTSDNEIIEVSAAVAEQSIVINNILEDSEEIVTLLPLPNVRAEVLKKVIEWMKKKHPGSGGEEPSEEEMIEWEKRYVDMDLEFMYEVIMAANYLNVSALLHRCCQKLADMIAGKSPEKIREIFGIVNDFTPEEEADLRRQNAWTFESQESETRTGGSTSTSGSGSGSESAPNQ